MKTTIVSFVLLLGMSQAWADSGPKDRPTTTKKMAPVVRNILSTQLPARLLTPIKKNYTDYWITDLRKESLNGKISYFITLENADQKVKLSATPATKWQVTRVITKDLANL